MPQPPLNQFDPLQLLESQQIPPPNADRKADTLLKANLVYREKISSKAQKTSLLARLFGRSTPAKERNMNRYTFAKGTGIAVVALIAVATTLDYAGDSKRQYGTASFQAVTAITADAPAPFVSGQLTDTVNNLSGNVSVLPSLDSFSVKPMVEALEEKITGGAKKDAATATFQSVARMDSGTPASAPVISPQYSREAEVDYAARNVIAPIPAPGIPDDNMSVQPESRDKFANLADNVMQDVAQAPVSTFSADTDTASYSTVRRMIMAGQLPPKDAVRTEEFINYFDYNYEVPADKAKPFTPTVAVYPTPWNTQTKLMHIGIKAYDLPAGERPPVNLVLLIDVSGSMNGPDRLDLVKTSFALMLDKLQPSDTVAIVTYAGYSGIALEPTSVEHKDKILGVIQGLGAGGSTAGAAGLQTAYELAKQNFRKQGVNRILLATDGDFNVGVSSPGGVAEYVASQRSSGVFLSVLGFGMGNYQDSTMQAIAQNGNGVAAYIDSVSEARRVLADQLTSTMFTVAKDVKLQVEFNPAAIKSYRLLGYETRALKREDFDNDKVDAGEVGAGHEVTAIYEVLPVGSGVPAGASGTSLRYQDTPAATAEAAKPTEPASTANELAFLRIRYKLPESDTSTLIEHPVTQSDVLPNIASASGDVRFAAAVTGFSRLLRSSQGMGSFGYQDVINLAAQSIQIADFANERAASINAERAGFVELAKYTLAISGSQPKAREDGGVAFPPPQ
jgi:Ca-activated chloride channel homolog